MVEPITLSQLSWRAFEGALSKEELSAYFLPDQAKSRSLAPAVRLNPELVDLEGRRPTTRRVNELRTEADSARIWRSASGRGKTKVLAEGDSWFNLPDLFLLRYPPDAMDILARTHDVWRVAMWSDEIGEMVSPANKINYMQPLGSGLFSHFVFSGGGNDVLGRMDRYLKRFGSPGTNPALPSSYLNDAFAAQIDRTIGHYRTLRVDVDRASPKTVLYVHGYANAIPKPGGPYIGRRMERLGFDPRSDLARSIVAEMVALFNRKLREFARSHSRVVYLDLRDEVADTDWHKDEIHPSASGARKIAASFAEQIAQNVPVG